MKHRRSPPREHPIMNAMTPIDPASGSLTMSSREIAKLTGKRHGNVIADIRTMLDQLNITELKFQSSYRDASGKSNLEFLLPKDLTITLVAGYRAELRHRIVTRWLELEEEKQSTAIALPDFSNPAAAARAWADEVEAKTKGQQKPPHLCPHRICLGQLRLPLRGKPHQPHRGASLKHLHK